MSTATSAREVELKEETLKPAQLVREQAKLLRT